MIKRAARAVPVLALALAIAPIPQGAAVPPGPVRCEPPDPSFTSTRGMRFASDRSGNPEIYETTSDPTAKRLNATKDPGVDHLPSAQSTAGLVAWVSERDGNPEIYCQEVGFYNAANLTQDPAVDTEPSMSLDGRRVAFQSDRTGNFDIWMMNNDGTGLQQLTSDAADDIEPAFSPDGTTIAFVSDTSGDNDVYVMNADGTGSPVDVTNDPADDRNPAFSKDGTLIAFDSDRKGNRDVYTVPIAGGAATRVTVNPASDMQPTFSPKDTRVAFTSDRSGNDDIWLKRLDGTRRPIDLTHNPAEDSDSDWQSAAPRTEPAPAPTTLILKPEHQRRRHEIAFFGFLDSNNRRCTVGRRIIRLFRSYTRSDRGHTVSMQRAGPRGTYRMRRHPGSTWFWHTEFAGSMDCRRSRSDVFELHGGR